MHVLYYGLGVEIEGSASALGELSDEISNCRNATQIVLANPTEMEARGLSSVNLLRISVFAGPVAITRLNKELSISGSKEKLALLAQNISSLAETRSCGNHPKFATTCISIITPIISFWHRAVCHW